jgi:methylglutaconyl-CoA hydratase
VSDPSSVLEAGTVQSEVRDGVATVRFAHPKSNSLPGVLLGKLADAISAAGRDPDALVIVLRSEGEGPFCAGASLDEFKAIESAEQGRRFFSGFAGVVLAILRAPKFVMTRVQGKTAGGGIGIAAASDYALATEAASLRLSELAVGIGPFVVGPVIERKLGLAAFSALAVDADWRTAAWARERGLYAEVLPDIPELDARVAQLAAKLAGYNPEAMRRMKESFWRGTEDWETLLAERAGISGELVLSEFTRKAIGR